MLRARDESSNDFLFALPLILSELLDCDPLAAFDFAMPQPTQHVLVVGAGERFVRLTPLPLDSSREQR